MPGFVFGFGTLCVQAAAGAAFGAWAVRRGLPTEAIRRIALTTAARTLRWGGCAFTLFGLFGLAFPGVADICDQDPAARAIISIRSACRCCSLCRRARGRRDEFCQRDPGVATTAAHRAGGDEAVNRHRYRTQTTAPPPRRADRHCSDPAAGAAVWLASPRGGAAREIPGRSRASTAPTSRLHRQRPRIFAKSASCCISRPPPPSTSSWHRALRRRRLPAVQFLQSSSAAQSLAASMPVPLLVLETTPAH